MKKTDTEVSQKDVNNLLDEIEKEIPEDIYELKTNKKSFNTVIVRETVSPFLERQFSLAVHGKRFESAAMHFAEKRQNCEVDRVFIKEGVTCPKCGHLVEAAT